MSHLVPLVSEKAFAGTEKGVYMFKVGSEATKLTVKRDIEARFSVKVTAVRMGRTPGKVRQRGRHVGFRPGFKKAIVQLAKGEKIEQLES